MSWVKLADMERSARKPSLTPRNPSELRKRNKDGRSRHSSGDDSWSKEETRRKTSRGRQGQSNLSVPNNRHRSISPRLEELSRASSRSSRRSYSRRKQDEKIESRRSSKSPALNRRKEKNHSGRSRRKQFYSDDFSDSSGEWFSPQRHPSRSPRGKQYYDREDGGRNTHKESKRNKKKTNYSETSKTNSSNNYSSSPKHRRNSNRREKSPKKKMIENDYENFPIPLNSENVNDKYLQNGEGTRHDNLEVCPDDPWGPNSPRHRIQNIEASFQNSNTELTNSDKELEDKILNDSLTAEKKEKSETVTIPHPTISEPIKIDDHNEKDVYEILTEKFELPVIPQEVKDKVDELLLQAYKDDEKDSCLGLSLGDLTSSRSSEPPSSDIAINVEDTHDEAVEDNDVQQWTFIPLPGEVPVLLGQVRDNKTGDIFNVFNDGPMESARNNSEEDLEKEEDIGWCSVYFCVRIVGLALVGAALGGLIWVAQM